MDYPRQQQISQCHGLVCPRCPLYLRDSPGLLHTNGAQTAVCSFGGRHHLWCAASLQWGSSCPIAGPRRLSVLLPERSDRCNQRSCAFGGFLCRKLSPDGWDSKREIGREALGSGGQRIDGLLQCRLRRRYDRFQGGLALLNGVQAVARNAHFLHLTQRGRQAVQA